MDHIVVNHKELQVLYGGDSHFRYMNLRINSYGQIEILTSRYMDPNQAAVFSFIKENAGFIKKELDFLNSMDLPTFKNDTLVNLLGKKYRVYRSKRIQRIIREENGIAIPRSFNMNKIRAYLEKLLVEALDEFINYYISNYNFNVPSYYIIDSDQVWGRCVYEGPRVWEHLEFNIALVFLPKELIDYIVLHELCHLRHHNHSKDFWNEVKKIMPDMKMREKQMKQYCLSWCLERIDIKRLRCY